MTPVIDVRLHVDATVEVADEATARTVRERIQAGLDEAVAVLTEHGATFSDQQTWEARVRQGAPV